LFDPYKPVPDMAYNVFYGTLNPAQSINVQRAPLLSNSNMPYVCTHGEILLETCISRD